ncbi:MAG: ABC transporter permease DevC [Pirellulales bacterium]|nr:ABC transporter permease DevC [Pirellulales bacterium]
MKRPRTNLAWSNLTHSWRTLALAVFGIGFAVLLMTMQIGFRNAMLDSTVAAIEQLNADLVITSTARYAFGVPERFSRRRLQQSLAMEGVAAAYPLYVETRTAMLENSATGIGHPIRVFAFEPNDPVFRLPEIREQQSALATLNTALFDIKSKREYGAMDTGTQTDLSGRTIRIVGTFALGTDFANDGNLMIGARSMAAIFRRPRAGQDGMGEVDIGLIRLKEPGQAHVLQARLLEVLPDDVNVLTRAGFGRQERQFWQRSTPVGFVFGLGTVMGFLVGIIFCYQILYSDISDHLAEFATLKAMGYSKGYFVGVVFQEALLLALFGFAPGIAVAGILYWILGSMTGLLLDLTVPRALLILALTLGMCLASAALAVRKVLSSDPAELF